MKFVGGRGTTHWTSLAHALLDEPWRDSAACYQHRTLPPTTWDDTAPGDRANDGEARKERIKAAKNVCNTECPVRAECLAAADLHIDSGIRGGRDLRDVRAGRWAS